MFLDAAGPCEPPAVMVIKDSCLCLCLQLPPKPSAPICFEYL